MRAIEFITLVTLLFPFAHLTFARHGSPKGGPTAESPFADVMKIVESAPRLGSLKCELDHWNRSVDSSARTANVRTKSGKLGTMFIFESSDGALPSVDQSVVILAIDKKVIDWVSCWTNSRIAIQTVVVEDVNGDKEPDIAFENKPGSLGSLDTRRHTCSVDKRVWLYAYSISDTGFKAHFPELRDKRPLTIKVDAKGEPVSLTYKNAPKSISNYELFEMTITLTNNGSKTLDVIPHRWFHLDLADVKCMATILIAGDESKAIKPGESISQTLRLLIHDLGEKPTVSVNFGSSPIDSVLKALEKK